MDQVVGLVRHTLALDDPAVQAAACEGVAKLMLAGMISDESVSIRALAQPVEADGYRFYTN